jgi:predicted O-methyltransferase YrrM
MALLPKALRTRTPERLRDDVRLRAAAVGLGLIPPRTMHSPEDAAVLLEAARGARRVVEIGVYEGSSALALIEVLGPGSELHLIDPFGRRPDALPSGWGATEWATRRLVSRRLRGLGAAAPEVVWHPTLSAEVAGDWSCEVDLVFIDGDHSEAGCALDWECWSPFVAPGGTVVFHDARAGRPSGRGLPGPTAVVERELRDGAAPGWEIAAEADRTVAVRRALPNAS